MLCGIFFCYSVSNIDEKTINIVIILEDFMFNKVPICFGSYRQGLYLPVSSPSAICILLPENFNVFIGFRSFQWFIMQQKPYYSLHFILDSVFTLIFVYSWLIEVWQPLYPAARTWTLPPTAIKEPSRPTPGPMSSPRPSSARGQGGIPTTPSPWMTTRTSRGSSHPHRTRPRPTLSLAGMR